MCLGMVPQKRRVKRSKRERAKGYKGNTREEDAHWVRALGSSVPSVSLRCKCALACACSILFSRLADASRH